MCKGSIFFKRLHLTLVFSCKRPAGGLTAGGLTNVQSSLEYSLNQHYRSMCAGIWICVIGYAAYMSQGQGKTPGPPVVFLSRASQSCQKASRRRCHGNHVSTSEGHKMECVFPSCWAPVVNDTLLKPHRHQP